MRIQKTSLHGSDRIRKTSLFLAAFGIAGLLAIQNAEARPGRFAGGGYRPDGYTSLAFRGRQMFFHNGYFYHRLRGGYYLAPAPIGIVVPFLPLDAIILRAGDLDFYYYGGNYYRETDDGYVVVSKPDTVLVQDVPADTDTTTTTQNFVPPESKTVMVKNSNGSHTPVLLEFVDGKWKGPRGEEYDAFPTNEQLRSAYGF